MVGNESLLRAEQTDETLAAYVAEVRSRVPRRVPVGTADTWSELLKAPKTVAVSDFVGIHTLPYWEKLESSGALPYVMDKIKRIRQAYPGKPIWVGEIGWPSDGDNFGDAHASRPEQARIIREFAQDAKRMGVEYNVIEAFDQPWKTAIEGSPGPHWGVLDADRQPKWQLRGAVEPSRKLLESASSRS